MSSVTDISKPQDSSQNTKILFDRYFTKEISYPSNEVDAVVGFFTQRGFEQTAAVSIAGILLQQAKIDRVNVFALLDSLKSFDKPKLSNLVTVILNENRSKISKIGYKLVSVEENIESRNIIF